MALATLCSFIAGIGVAVIANTWINRKLMKSLNALEGRMIAAKGLIDSLNTSRISLKDKIKLQERKILELENEISYLKDK